MSPGDFGTSTASRPSRFLVANTFIIYFGFALTGAGTTMLGSALPVIMRRFELGDIQGGYLFAAQFLSSSLGVILSGRLTNRFGFKWTLGPAFLLVALGITTLTWAVWPACILAVACYGFGLGIAIPTCNLHVAAMNPVRRASALNILNFVWTGGALAWAPFAATISARPLAFVSIGAFVGLYALLLFLLPLPDSGGTIPEKKEQSTVSFKLGLALSTAALFFLYVGVENAWAGWATSFAQRMDSTFQHWIWAPAYFWGALLTGRAIAPLLLNHITEEMLLKFDLAGATCAGFIVLTARSVPAFFVGLSLAGFCLSSAYPNLIARMTRDFERRPGDVGWMFASAGVGAAVMPWAVGAASSYFGSLRVGLIIPFVGCATMLLIHLGRNHFAEQQVNRPCISTSKSQA